MSITADVVWRGLKARIEACPLPVDDQVSQVDGFKCVNSMSELEAMAVDRTTAVIPTEGPSFPERAESRCREWVRFSVVVYYLLATTSLERALRDTATLRDYMRTLSLSVPGVISGSKVAPAIWDLQSFAGENGALVTQSVLVEYEAFPPGGS